MMMLKALEEFLRLVANLSAKRSSPAGPIRWLAYLAGWTLFGVFFISEDASRLLLQRRLVQWHGYLAVWLTTAYAGLSSPRSSPTTQLNRDNPSPNWLPALRVLEKIANFPDDRHRFGWSGAPSRRTASPD